MCTISFPQSHFPDLDLAARSELSQHLTVQNSPILFGCRTGLCGTCLVRAEGNIPPALAEEQELLAILAPDDPHARLACQIVVTGDLALQAHPNAR